MPPNVLIAAPEHLPALKERVDLGEILTFSDSEALRALDVITRQRPAVVALERLFAATTRGAALINRIKADPTLAICEIRIVSHDGEYVSVQGAATPAEPTSSGRAVAERLRSSPNQAQRLSAVPAQPLPLASPQAPTTLDRVGTRRAPRVRMVEGIEILVDGNPATLVDLSAAGAQITSPTILRPNQRLRVSLPDSAKPIRVSAGVIWASFEMPKDGPRYRAGLEFFDGDAAAITRFCEQNKQ